MNDQLLNQIRMFLSSGDFNSALNCCRTLLNTDPENGWGYFYCAMAEMQLRDEKMLADVDWNRNPSLQMAQRFADDDLKIKIFQLIAAQNSSMPQSENESIVIGEEFLKEQNSADNDPQLRQECQNRLALLNQYLNYERISQKRPAVIDALNRSIIAENNILSYSGRLTDEIVQPIKAASENAIFTVGNSSGRSVAAAAKPKKKGLLIFSALAVVIVLAVGIYFLANSGKLSSGDVCEVENNVVVGLKFNKKDITKCVIPDGVTKVGKAAFSGCENLTEVTIPDSVEEIGAKAFERCEKLEVVVVPDDCRIGEEAFPAECAVIYPGAEKYWDDAQKGDAGAQYQLGKCLADGKDAVKNSAAAVYWYRKSAEQGYVAAQYNLGLCYYDGVGVAKDLSEAVKWYRKSAEQGNAVAQYNLGLCYDDGVGVAKDLAEAIKWYRKAAEQGHARSQLLLGFGYENGIVVAKNLSEALKWYHVSATQGNSFAQLCLGRKYFYGVGVKENYSLAKEWFLKSAEDEDGSAMAEFYLGQMYETGKGVEKNFSKAIEWYEKSARRKELYYPSSSYSLGRLFFEGRGVKRDFKKAKEYFEQAITQGYHCNYALQMAKSELGELDSSNKMREYADNLIKKNIPKTKLYGQIEKDLQKDFGDTWNIVDEKAKNCLITAMFNYVVLFSYGPELCGNLDFSGIVLDLCKALEIQLAKYLYSDYVKYLINNDFPTELFDSKRSFLKRKSATEFAYKDPLDLKEFTLGNMHLTVGLEYLPQLSSDSFYKYYIDDSMLDYLDSVLKKEAFGEAGREREITDYIVSLTQEVNSISDSLRNPAAHNELVKYKRAEVCGNYIIKVQRLLIEFLEKIKTS